MATKEKIRASIDIEAPPQQVWSVLTDFEKLSEWSSSFRGLNGDFKQGGSITVLFKSPLGGTTKMKKKLFQLEEGKSFGWTGVFMLGMSDCHMHKIEALNNGNTRFTQTDGLSGGAAFLLSGMLEKQMMKGYQQFNQELKQRVESLNKS